MVIAFATSSSEAALPKLIEGLTKFGIEKRTTGFVLPLGYSFNVDGSMMYMTFASVFLINAYGIDMDLGQQIAMTAMLLLSSKGMAGVPRGSLVVRRRHPRLRRPGRRYRGSAGSGPTAGHGPHRHQHPRKRHRHRRHRKETRRRHARRRRPPG